MSLDQDDASIAWNHWPAQFDGKPRLEALVRALLQPAHELGVARRAMESQRWLGTAEGKQLDGIGQIVGQPRTISEASYQTFFGFVSQLAIGGFGQARFRRAHESVSSGSATLNDEQYRKWLQWKIAVNNGHGTNPEIVSALKAILGAKRVIVADAGNAKIRIWVGATPRAHDELLFNPYRWIPKAAGVGVRVITTSTDQPFGFFSQGFDGFGIGTMARGISNVRA